MTYRYLPPEDVASLPEREAHVYQAQRRAFAAEVERLAADAARTGVVDLGYGARWVLRCTGRAGPLPCLRSRKHDGACSPRWSP